MTKNYKYDLNNNCPDRLKANKLKSENIIYLIAKTINVAEHDFKPYYFSEEKYKKNRVKNITDPKKICQSQGLSVHDCIGEIIKKIKKMPNLGEYIFYASITKEGELYETPTNRYPRHLTFYIFEDYEEKEIFRCCIKRSKNGKY